MPIGAPGDKFPEFMVTVATVPEPLRVPPAMVTGLLVFFSIHLQGAGIDLGSPGVIVGSG